MQSSVVLDIMKERSYRFDDDHNSSSQGSSSFSVEYPGLKPMPSFSKLQEQKAQPYLKPNNSRKNITSRKEIEALFTTDTIPKRQERSHLSYLVTPEKGSDLSHLGVNSVLYSPREVLSSHSPKPSLSPKPSMAGDRDVYQRRIRQMTKDWAVEKASLRKEIKQLEFIVQQWQLLDERKANSGIATQHDRFDVGSPRQSLQLTVLQKRLQECEREKEEMYRDFIEMEKQLKKVRPITNFEQSLISDVRNLEFSNNSHEDSVRHVHEMESLRLEYERRLSEKDVRYQQLLADFTELQEELEKQRSQTMILLQKRTNELENNLTTLKVANDEINTELRSSIDRTNRELREEKGKNRLLENQLSYKEHGMKVLEQELENSRKSMEELRETFMNKCVQFEMAKMQPDRDVRKKQDISSQTVSIRLKDEHCQTHQSQSPVKLGAVPPTYREEYEKLLRKSDKLEQILSERQTSYGILMHAKNELGVAYARLEANYNIINQEKTRLEGELRRQISNRQASELRNSRAIDSARDEQLNELKAERIVYKKEIESLKGELDQCRRRIDSYRNEQQYEKIHLSSQDRVTRNNYEVEIHNLTGQLDSSRIKLEGVEARLQLRKRELKEKDDFIRNTIVSRVGKHATESELEYLLKKIDEFVGCYRKSEQQ